MTQSRAQLLAYESAQEIRAYRDDCWATRGTGLTPFDVYVDSLRGTDCIYCRSRLEKTDVLDEMRQRLRVSSCPECGWWAIDREMVGGQDNLDLSLSVAVAKVFDVSDIEVPLESLRLYLRRNPKDLAEVNPTTFERLIQDCLEDEFAPCEVRHVGGTGDGGIDLKLIESDREPILVQVKRHVDLSSPEGVDAIRSLNGVLFREGLARGMVVTTASRYTRGAPAEARTELPELAGRYEMKLRAFDDVVSMVRLPTREKQRPWLEHLPSYYGLGGGIDDAIERHLEEMGELPPLADATPG